MRELLRLPAVLAVVLAGCTPPADDMRSDAPPAFTAPWDGLAVTDDVTGECITYVGTDVQGAGWFHTHGAALWGTEGCWVSVSRPAGATDDIVAVTLVGRDGPDGWLTLEFDIAAHAFNAGTVAVDGTDAIGVLARRAGDETTPLAYAVDGSLAVTDAGADPDDDIELSFDDISLAAVTP
jgi:hypothetical protein